MESQAQLAYPDSHLKRISKVIEVIIRKGVKSNYRLPSNTYYYATIRAWLEMYRQRCYPMGFGNERIIDYLLYQIYRQRDYIANGGRWTLTWLFTENAVDRYKNQFLSETGKAGMKYYIDEWAAEHKLTIARLLNRMAPTDKHPLAAYIYMPSEEPIKKRWFNTEMGFILCVRSTTGWSPQSVTCNQCNFQQQCIIETEKKYPELVRLRKEQQNG